MIENKLLYFLTYFDFKSKLDEGKVDAGSVVFIKDRSIIWTHGKEFVCTSGQMDLWRKIQEIMGTEGEGINMTVSPTYYFDESANVVIHATAADSVTGKFQSIAFYINDELIYSDSDVEEVDLPVDPEEPISITGRAEIKCVAVVNGEEYTETRVVSKVTSFFIGAGSAPADIIDEDHQHDISGGMTGYYDVEVADGDYIMIVMDSSYESQFERADMNGFEIPFDIDRETISGNTVYKSVNAYQAGTYRIYINR